VYGKIVAWLSEIATEKTVEDGHIKSSEWSRKVQQLVTKKQRLVSSS